MRCPKCGEEIFGEDKFCPNCGTKISVSSGNVQSHGESINIGAQKQNGEITCGEDGVYRWLYEYKMFKNPAMLFMLWRMFLWAIVIGWLILIPCALLARADWDSILGILLAFGVTALVAALTLGTIGYIIYAIYNGGHLFMLFEMDEEGITMTLAPKTFERQKAIMWFSIASGLTVSEAPNVLLDSALVNKKSQSSSFENTTRVLVKKWYNCLHLRQLLGYNLIYVNKEDFDFVWEYIKARIPEKCKVRSLF